MGPRLHDEMIYASSPPPLPPSPRGRVWAACTWIGCVGAGLPPGLSKMIPERQLMADTASNACSRQICVWLVGLTPVGHVVVRVHRKVGIRLGSRTHLSWCRRVNLGNLRRYSTTDEVAGSCGTGSRNTGTWLQRST